MQGIRFLQDALVFGMKPGLENMKKLCTHFGNPEQSFKSIHVIGINGKGSTAFYLSEVLEAHGKKTGFFSSPHLVSLQERIRVSGVFISKEDLEFYLKKIQQASKIEKISPTFFEILSMLTLLYFRDQKVEYAVLEAGLGGRLDSTAIAKGAHLILTSVGLDHTEILGNSKEQILKEKLAIGKKGSVLVRHNLGTSLENHAKVIETSFGFNTQIVLTDTTLKLENLGKHYQENASLSLAMAKILLENEYSHSLALKSLSQSAWLGRMQVLKNKEKKLCFILDGAHNPAALHRLIQSLQENFPHQKFPCLFAAVQDKDVQSMFVELKAFVSDWFLTKTDYNRFIEIENLKDILETQELKASLSGELSKEFLEDCQNLSQDKPILVVGSLYLVGAVLNLLKDDYESLLPLKNLEAFSNETR